MQLLHKLITFLGIYLIKGIFISVLLILLAKIYSKEKINTVYASLIIKWTILFYAFLLLTQLLILLFPFQTDYNPTFINRAFGPYYWAYWSLILFGTFLPLFLLHNKWGKNIYILLSISLFMNFGWLFESFVIHMTGLQRDFATELNPYLPLYGEKITIFRGLCLGLIVLLMGYIFKFYRSKKIRKNPHLIKQMNTKNNKIG